MMIAVSVEFAMHLEEIMHSRKICIAGKFARLQIGNLDHHSLPLQILSGFHP